MTPSQEPIFLFGRQENPGAACARLRTRPTKESIPEVVDFLDRQIELWDIPMGTGHKLQIAADEIYSNIVYYSGAETVCICICDDGELVHLGFEDDGVPYDPLTAKTPDVTASAEDREVGGLGLFMVRKMVETMVYSFEEGKNRLQLSISKAPKKRKPERRLETQ